MVKGLVKLNREFYERDTLAVAKELLGKYLVHKTEEGKTIGKIVETEAYIGPNDRASHAFRNIFTERTKIQFGAGGFAYIYQIYGLHFCFNVVTQKKNMPEVVLIRALEPVQGNELMAKRRKLLNLSDGNIQQLTNGPAKLCQAIGIDKSCYGIDLCENKLFICQPKNSCNFEVHSTSRINIDYAKESKNYPWRFVINDNIFVSKI